MTIAELLVLADAIVQTIDVGCTGDVAHELAVEKVSRIYGPPCKQHKRGELLEPFGPLADPCFNCGWPRSMHEKEERP